MPVWQYLIAANAAGLTCWKKRPAGCKDGDTVDLGGKEFEWHYPDGMPSAKEWPSGFAKWNSTIDGIKGVKTLETGDPIWDLPKAEVTARVDALMAGIVAGLTA